MRSKFNLLHSILLILICLIIFRFDRISDSSLAFVKWLVILFTDFSSAVSQLNSILLDDFVSIFILIHVIVFTLLFKNYSFFFRKITFLNTHILLLVTVILFAPLLTDQHPNHFTDIGTTKLLPPFSSKQVFYTKSDTNNDSVNESDFNKVYADSCFTSGTDFYFIKKNKLNSLPLTEIKTINNVPLIKNSHFILGTDQYGRDVFTRVLYGARVSIIIGLFATLISLLLGISLGFWAGYSENKIGLILTRINDTFLFFPMIFLAIMILMFFGSNLISIVLVLGLSGWMSLFKIVKDEVIKIKNKNYFLSSKMLGASKRDLFFIDILPMIAVPITVNMIFQFGNVIVAESALSFIGLSLSSDLPSWGKMIENGQEYIKHAWWLVTFPSLALIFTLMLSNNFAQKINKKINPRIS